MQGLRVSDVRLPTKGLTEANETAQGLCASDRQLSEAYDGVRSRDGCRSPHVAELRGVVPLSNHGELFGGEQRLRGIVPRLKGVTQSLRCAVGPLVATCQAWDRPRLKSLRKANPRGRHRRGMHIGSIFRLVGQ